MWISNTAVTAFMVPIAQGVLLSLNREMRESLSREGQVSVKFTASGKHPDNTEQVLTVLGIHHCSYIELIYLVIFFYFCTKVGSKESYEYRIYSNNRLPPIIAPPK